MSECESSKPPLLLPGSLRPCADDQDDDEREKLSCRVCWQSESSEANLLSPCRCSGTQRHIHLKCLRRWQENVQKRDAADERAFRCSVCRALFSVPPTQARSGTVAVQALRGIGGAICISLLAFGLSGPPWPHLALLVLLLLASRSHWLPGLALLLVCTLLATMHARGLRIILRLGDGGRLGIALIRHGAPVVGVGPGVLLVASERLDHSIFRRSVVLLTQHGRDGAHGLILTQPMTAPPPTGQMVPDEQQVWAGDRRTSEAAGSSRNHSSGSGRGQQAHRAAGSGGGGHVGIVMKHFLGGPVGMPGEGVNHEVVVLHSLSGVAGARRILPPVNAPAAAVGGPAAGAGSAIKQTSPGFPLYEGGSMSEVLGKASDAASAASVAPVGQPGETVPPVLLFHGVCAWAEGQLEGELRAGAWGFTSDLGPGVLSLLSLPPDQLWRALVASARTA